MNVMVVTQCILICHNGDIGIPAYFC